VQRFFPSLTLSDRFGPTHAPVKRVLGAFLPVLAANQSLASDTEVNNGWSCTSATSYVSILDGGILVTTALPSAVCTVVPGSTQNFMGLVQESMELIRLS
jgi:hypothetical protein